LTATIGQCNQILEFRKRHLDRVERIPVQPTLLQFESSDVQTPSSRSTKTYPTPKWISPNYKLSHTGTAEDPSSEERTLATSELNTNEQQAAKEFKKINRANSTPSTAGSDTWAEEVNRLLKIPLSPKFSKSKDISNSKESDRGFNIPKELGIPQNWVPATSSKAPSNTKDHKFLSTKYPNWYIKQPTASNEEFDPKWFSENNIKKIPTEEELRQQPKIPLWESEKKKQRDHQIELYNAERKRQHRLRKSPSSGTSVDGLNSENWASQGDYDNFEDDYDDYWVPADTFPNFDEVDFNDVGSHEYYERNGKGSGKQ